MPSVYIVSGNTGEYSDYRSWEVGAFMSREKADAECARLNQWCKDNSLHRSQEKRLNPKRDDFKPEADARFQCDYNGTEYVVVEVELRDG